MAKKKKIVDISKNNKDKPNVTLDSHRRIVEVKDKGEAKPRATSKRIIAIVLWLLALFFEIVGILRLNGTINWFSSLNQVTFLIICLILDLILVVIGSQIWKKANHIDPASEKDKTKFWIQNNLGVIISVIAFLPIIIVVLLNKDLSKKEKTIVSVVAIIALLIAGFSSYDYNPVSSEQLKHAENEVLNVSKDGYVYWAPHSKKYHVDKDCRAFSQSETVYKGTVADAFEAGLTEPCRICIPKLEEEEE